MSFDLENLKAAVAVRCTVIRVVVAETRGSIPRGPGAAMLVWDDGQSGTIGGGTLEHMATQAAREQLALGTESRISRHPLGPALAQCCGGAVTLVSERWDAARLEAHTKGPMVLRRVDGEADLPFALRGVLRNTRNASLVGTLTFSAGWLAEPISRPARAIWVHGAGHVGRALISVLAPLTDFDIVWTDTGKDRFPQAAPECVTILPCPDPVQLLSHAPKTAEHFVLTYSHNLDFRLCDGVLRHGFGRAGLIGSATKWARFRTRLAALGHTKEAIDRITCPIGDPSLGKAPQQIAIGVAQRLLSDGQPKEMGQPDDRKDTA